MESIRDQYAQKIVSEHQAPFETAPGGIPNLPGPTSSAPEASYSSGGQLLTQTDPLTIGIIGAGVTGLYIGMTLTKVNAYLVEKKLKPIKFEILESESSSGGHPVGGRLWTHTFSDSANDYYDRGAMRFPDHPPMKPVMELFDELGLQKVKIPYIMSIDNNINLFNSAIRTNVQVQAAAEAGNYDPFRTRVKGLTGTVDDMVNAQIDPFRNKLKENFEEGWKEIMKFDTWSARGYMTTVGSPGVGTYTTEVVDYLETFAAGSTMFNQALSETVMDSMAFDYPGKFNWWAIQGGSSVIAAAMAKKLPSNSIVNGKRVTALKPAIRLRAPSSGHGIPIPVIAGVNVTVHGETAPRKYTHVISTTSFGSFRMINTVDCYLSWDLQSALRSLSYDGSTKVGIKFKERWWEKLSAPQKGGVSYTDRPTRVVVYPSYGIGGSDATMIVSYTWAQDAYRLGSFQGGKEKEQILLDAILKDLTDMHRIEDPNYLRGLLVDYDVWSWYHDENAVGAFALFGPQQFSRLYREVTKPSVEGRLHIAGEAASVWHAWVLGALNSASRVLREIFIQKLVAKTFGEHSQAVFDIVDNAFHFTELDRKLLTKQIALGVDRKFDPEVLKRLPHETDA
ncbi:hypothetical protein BXZ70DRAFT_329577 [Cristinia sonorae]|uniref:Amine oxidase domain-containing protein n=1 Tax=Cristinia sonorae TaxID=1940300 RepID=A0A8K0XNU9_9AGAR|nr:hypothetical protein BXZ70DRAFT_329577 [Cristinia sonorae]